MGEVLRAVEQKAPNALVIVTADHGESLGEHGEMEHGIFLYDATLRVPLIMAGPMVRPGCACSSRCGTSTFFRPCRLGAGAAAVRHRRHELEAAR